MKQFTTIHSSFDKQRVCPYCNEKVDDSTGEDIPPIAGDLSLCLYCDGMMIYTGTGNKLSLEKIGGEELEKVFEEHPYLREELEAAKLFAKEFREFKNKTK